MGWKERFRYNEERLMRVTKLVMRNFRGIGELSLDLGSHRTTVFVGINGAGKSSILDCIATLFASMLGPVFDVSAGGLPEIEDSDIMNGARQCTVEMTAMYKGEEQTCSIRAEPDPLSTKPLTMPSSRWSGLGAALAKVRTDRKANIPVVVYYPVNRMVLGTPLDEMPKHRAAGQLAALEGALLGVFLEFKSFFQWFRIREDIENEERISDPSYRDRQIDAVRKAIEKMVPGFSNPRVLRVPPRMVVGKLDERTNVSTELQIDQLSDGEKCLIAMVGDLARRLAIANPGLDDPLEGEGVVLIDEIELHLHPAWQRMIIPALERSFPNCQFIVTTHSPQVLSNVKPEAIYLLEQTPEGIRALRPISSYGRDSNRILEELMGVPERPEEIKRDLQQYFRFIDEGRMAEASDLRAKLEAEIGSDDPEFARADVLIRRREILGR
jgi:predicted ATP-binding protein involved in virulence